MPADKPRLGWVLALPDPSTDFELEAKVTDLVTNHGAELFKPLAGRENIEAIHASPGDAEAAARWLTTIANGSPDNRGKAYTDRDRGMASLALDGMGQQAERLDTAHKRIADLLAAQTVNALDGESPNDVVLAIMDAVGPDRDIPPELMRRLGVAIERWHQPPPELPDADEIARIREMIDRGPPPHRGKSVPIESIGQRDLDNFVITIHALHAGAATLLTAHDALAAFASDAAETLSEFGNGTTDAEISALRDRAFEAAPDWNTRGGYGGVPSGPMRAAVQAILQAVDYDMAAPIPEPLIDRLIRVCQASPAPPANPPPSASQPQSRARCAPTPISRRVPRVPVSSLPPGEGRRGP